MRANGGGDPAGVAFLTSYLFDKRTHLNDLYWREGDRTEEFWTREDVPGKKFGQQKAVYVLTSPRTFSGAEEFSYNLQQLGRATLVGETTGGGANPGRSRQLTPTMHVFVPNGKAINPITKTNWEHTGVVPDVKVPASDALATAQKMALEKLSAAPPRKASN
jgi:C-terminal processing protease CtpA/Prc